MKSVLWKKYQHGIQLLSKHRAFLAIKLREHSEFDVNEISRFFEAIQSWMKENRRIDFFLLFNRQREEFWQEPARIQKYQELICVDISSNELKGCVWKNFGYSSAEMASFLRKELDDPLKKIAEQQKVPVLSSRQPLLLETVQIPKPWGHEEWYTGVEKRGVVSVVEGRYSTELPYAMSLFRQEYLKDHSDSLILMKTLNPVAEEVIGDLYLEMHEQKWEVYVVTSIDLEAWPSGEGVVKAGLNTERVLDYQERFGDEWARPYLEDFREQIAVYEKTRREIDLHFDELRKKEGIDLLEPLTPALTQVFLNQIPELQRKNEKQLREQVYDFVGKQKVRVGDVVTFPPRQMHSLQHGVEVIEFQTPHFERLIVMFGQKVLTQSNWDTDDAFAVMKPEIYQSPTFEKLGETEAWKKERIVDFPDFVADRITVQPQCEYTEQTGDDYHLLIGVTGEGTIHSSGNTPFTFASKSGVFLPASLRDYTIRNSSKSLDAIPLIYLKAMPKS
ncbi:MAG: hypothetical protein HQM13_16515 [SAR324 cluster bacterium]|nr:hypothetical protein [SAR324 cluster bacterium]